MQIDHKLFFDCVRDDPFGGELSQEQVDGMKNMLDYWQADWSEAFPDLRWLAYILATAKWETASTMQPIEEYGKGEGKPYGEQDPETGQTYYGRGLVQLTWRDNYRFATQELGLKHGNDLEKHADRALGPVIATAVIFEGMREGWFTGKALADYFNDETDDPVNARQIVNGNDHDEDIAALHHSFLLALQRATIAEPPDEQTVAIAITAPEGVAVTITLNGANIAGAVPSRP